MTRRTMATLVAAAVVALGATGCGRDLGTPGNPVKLWVVPSEPGEPSAAAARTVADLLARQTGLAFDVEVPSRYVDLVTALGSEQADVAFTNDMAYLVANERFGATATLAVVRADGSDSYKAALLARTDSGITDLSHIAGRRIAYVDVFSVAGYIMPAMLLRTAGVRPAAVVKAGSHDAVVRMVYVKGADVGFTYLHPAAGGQPAQDARSHLAREFPDVDSALKVVAATEDIPNEPVVFRKDLPPDLRKRVEDGLLAVAATGTGRTALRTLHDITGFRRVDDAAYDPIRRALAGLGQKLDDALPGGGLIDLGPAPPIPPLGS